MTHHYQKYSDSRWEYSQRWLRESEAKELEQSLKEEYPTANIKAYRGESYISTIDAWSIEIYFTDPADEADFIFRGCL